MQERERERERKERGREGDKMGNTGSNATGAWSRTCATTGKMIGDGPDLLFIQSLSKKEKREALALMREEEFLKAKVLWLDQMISNTLDEMSEVEGTSDEWKELKDKCETKYNADKLKSLTKLKVLKLAIQKLRQLSLSKTGETISSPVTATINATGSVLKKTGDVVARGTKNTMKFVSDSTKNTMGQSASKEENDGAKKIVKTDEVGKDGKGKSTTRGELASSTESVRRESVVAKEKQIDGLVEEAKSFENDLKKVEEEDISEDQIEKRMKELEQS